MTTFRRWFPVSMPMSSSQATKEARELIKEMREAISNLLEGKNKVFECSCEAQDVDELEVKTGKAFFTLGKAQDST